MVTLSYFPETVLSAEEAAQRPCSQSPAIRLNNFRYKLAGLP